MSGHSVLYVTDVSVSGFKKINKSYVYIIQTTWSDGKKFELYRKYGDFFSFQDSLLKAFPKEAGRYDDRDRRIPYLPTVDNVFKLFGRTNSEVVLQQRLLTINHYCKAILVRLGDHITRSDLTLSFFNPTKTDKQKSRLERPATLHPQKIPTGNLMEIYVLLADYESDPNRPHQLSASVNEEVMVMRKDESGWLLCSKPSTEEVGWIPSSYLTKKIDVDKIELGFPAEVTVSDEITSNVGLNAGDDKAEESCLVKFLAIDEYTSEEEGQVSFPKDAIITVIDKDEDGWWFVSYKDEEGWAPSSYLEPFNGQSTLPAHELDEVYVKPTPVDYTSSSLSKTSIEADNGVSTTVPSSNGVMAQVPFVVGQGDCEVFYVKCDYRAAQEDELSLSKGAAIEILNKSVSGWWTARLNGRIGVVPATFLSSEPIRITGTGSDKAMKFTSLGVSIDKPSGNSGGLGVIGGYKYARPPPRRKTVRFAVQA